MKLPWPEITSSHRPDDTIRQILDYLVWITAAMSQVGFHGGGERERWRVRAQQAYQALFLPPIAGHGDPYPPDVPPPRNPGIWPDIPAAALPGMTLRHQLKVIGLLARDLRDRVWAHGREPEFAEWDRRLALARAALDHGPSHPLPDEERTQPSAAALQEAEAQEVAKRDLLKRREKALRQIKARAARARKTSTRSAPKKATPKAKAKAKPRPAKKKVAVKKKTPAAKKKAPAKKKVAVKKKAAPKKKAATGRKKAAAKSRKKGA